MFSIIILCLIVIANYFVGKQDEIVQSEAVSSKAKIAYVKREYKRSIKCAKKGDWDGFIKVFDSSTKALFYRYDYAYGSTRIEDKQTWLMIDFIQYYPNQDFVNRSNLVAIVQEDGKLKLKLLVSSVGEILN
jgi:hypothetical protein